jgi:Flp pilus assembly protein CpaB
VFAIALAIVAGLIFAWLFKLVLLDKPKVVPPKDDSVEVTVAASNIWQNWEVKPIQVKKVKMSKADYDAQVKRAGREPLKGNQPVGRVTKHMIRAETFFYDDDLLELSYPEPVDKFIRPGYRSVIVTVPAKEAMVQTGNYVDVYCTMSNDLLGPGGNGTAEIAKAAKVVARFGTTRQGAQPPGGNDAPRQYTLEVTPYRMAMIELAKTVGGKFSLGVVPTTTEGDSVVPPQGNDLTDPREQSADHVSGDDLAALFDIQPKPEKPGPWVIEKYEGIHEKGTTTYPGYVPPSKMIPSGASPAANGKPSAMNSVRPAANTTFAMNTRHTPGRFTRTTGDSLAGFKAPNDPDKVKGCPTCGKK